MGPWHRTIVDVACGMLITAVATRYSDTSGWLIVVAVGLIVLTFGHGWLLPHVRQWRAACRSPGYLKIVGGYRTDSQLVIRYRGGKQDVTVFAASANVDVRGHGVGVMTQPSPPDWTAWRLWWGQRPGQK